MLSAHDCDIVLSCLKLRMLYTRNLEELIDAHMGILWQPSRGKENEYLKNIIYGFKTLYEKCLTWVYVCMICIYCDFWF